MITQGTHFFKLGLTLFFRLKIAISASEMMINATPVKLTAETFSCRNISAKNIEITADRLRMAIVKPLCPSFNVSTSIACEAVLTIPVTRVNADNIPQLTSPAMFQSGSSTHATAAASKLLTAKN